ncbi:thiamine biosynthesis lipoprotein [Moraxella cuniculi DSM 21768]|uniref:FAD:protein FMN transferase n=2 Tax=Moraxella cuniculi TaxID=34061 RepID=A0A1N7FP91_9GAMM|nr:thiamine biosynthesis lipoprotein [Moraxella cuniculi DSM 21768]
MTMRYAYVALACSAIVMAACDSKPSYQRISGETMGTSYHISLQANKADLAKIQSVIDKRLQDINNSMSTYQQDSTISRFNRLQANTPLVIDADFIKVLTDSQQVYQASNRAFDPTVYPLVELWGFGSKMSVERLQSPPSDSEIAAASALVGLDKISLEGDKISKRTQGIGLDFSAIAKGYAVDVIANTLRENYGINNYMVEIGGEVATMGVNDKGRAWVLGIDAPVIDSTQSNRTTLTTLTQPAGGSLHIATSGGYRNSVVYDGKRYSHTINPVTGKPVADNAPSVTVLHDTVALADAWATALTAMPYQQAINLANEQGVMALFVIENANKTGFELVKSTAMQQKFTQ